MAEETLKQPPSRLPWGDLDEEEDDLSYLLPPKQVIGPDENGIKKVIEFKFQEDERRVKITSTYRTRKLASARLSKRAVERRSWPKFSDDVDEDLNKRLTLVSTEDIFLERPGAPGTKQEETKVDPQNKPQAVMVCRTCGKKGDHWTARCPYKDLVPQTDTFLDKPPSESNAANTTKSSYVPPSKRPGAEISVPTRRNEEYSVRVTNLSEDAREADLLELFSPFGAVSRVYVAVDHKTGISRGFGFVNFVSREDGEIAIKKLDGYGYDNLILRVEWAAPRSN